MRCDKVACSGETLFLEDDGDNGTHGVSCYVSGKQSARGRVGAAWRSSATATVLSKATTGRTSLLVPTQDVLRSETELGTDIAERRGPNVGRDSCFEYASGKVGISEVKVFSCEHSKQRVAYSCHCCVMFDAFGW